MITRRHLLQLAGSLPAVSLAADKTIPEARQITRGPKFHWFGYYDKWQFDPSSRYVLGMEVDFEHRSPKPDDEIRLGQSPSMCHLPRCR